MQFWQVDALHATAKVRGCCCALQGCLLLEVGSELRRLNEVVAELLAAGADLEGLSKEVRSSCRPA